MLQVCFDCYGSYTTDSVYQWDLNRRLAIRGLDYDSAPAIHFSNKKSTQALVVQSTIEDGVIYCDVPNILLQDPYDIVGYVCECLDQELTTHETIRIPVKPRVKPADYAYENNVEILTYYALMSEITSVKASTEKDLKSMDASKASKTELNTVKVDLETSHDSDISRVENEIASERARIDQLVASPEMGEGDLEKEVGDLRIDTKGTTHGSAGTAVREQIQELNSKIDDEVNTLSSEIVEIEKGLNEITPEQTTFIESNVLFSAKEFKVVADTTTWDYDVITLTDLGLTNKDSVCISIDSTTCKDDTMGLVYFYANNGDTSAVSNIAISKNEVVGVWKKLGVPTNVNQIKICLYASTSTPISVGSIVKYNGVKVTKNKEFAEYTLANNITVNNMNYIYVSTNGSDVNGDGSKEKPFATIYKANESITDNSKDNPYTIIVGQGTYTDLQERYNGTYSGVYEGVICKDYVYYESENINRPDLTIISWNGAVGFANDTTFTDAMFNDKCPFHIVGDIKGMHTHIKGFTFVCENTRYALHVETEGKGINTEWLVENCVFDWRGKSKLNTYHLEPAIGMGSSPFEKGRIANCNIFNPNLDNVGGKNYNGIQNHNNGFSSEYGFTPFMICGADIEIENCNLNDLRIEFRTWSENYDTFDILTLRNLSNVNMLSFGFVGSATKQNWKGVVEACDIKTNNIG